MRINTTDKHVYAKNTPSISFVLSLAILGMLRGPIQTNSFELRQRTLSTCRFAPCFANGLSRRRCLTRVGTRSRIPAARIRTQLSRQFSELRPMSEMQQRNPSKLDLKNSELRPMSEMQQRNPSKLDLQNGLNPMKPLSHSSQHGEISPISSSRQNTFTLSDMLQYLNQVEIHLQRPSLPANECHYCYQSDNPTTFFKYVGATLAKPMMRTLIYGDVLTNNDDVMAAYNSITESEFLRNRQRTERVRFDERIRDERVLMEFERMSRFVLQDLRPALLELDADLRDNFVPKLNERINAVEALVEPVRNGQKVESRALSLFHRLASGRYYQGKLGNLVSDLFPELYETYKKASQRITEREVLERLIDLDLVNNRNIPKNDEFQRRISAARNCLDMFYPASRNKAMETCTGARADLGTDRYAEDSEAECPVASGRKAEESCIRYIVQRRQESVSSERKCRILRNVYVNTRRNYDTNNVGIPTPKYKPPKTHKNGFAIIWTSEGGTDRYRVCSEFDVLILNSCHGRHSLGTLSNDHRQCISEGYSFVEAIWEAKRTISPSTLYDVLTKKLAAVELLLDDESAELVYEDGESAGTLPISPSTRQHNTPTFTFGIYGIELLHPQNAADSIRSVAGANVVSSNLNEVICAIERCTESRNELLLVEVETNRALSIVDKLKKLVKEKIKNEKNIQILVCIDEEVDFMG
ncbi:hypothetical protein HJC23_002178 [Cyclotella cryptica]|uniref:CARD domain-containing protein n=1 Tax=Cyclotella cryptica TaxID=29204 RepID=A0ABD3Q777_9STRA|eukprot:CCRYP_008207-RA/>CCRYP_008207-RA protein AED:0.12 eAED:0.12 QI:0/-1/0/1/-1/1/1/0/698